MKFSSSSLIIVLINLFYLKCSIASDVKSKSLQKIGEVYFEKMHSTDVTYSEECKNLIDHILQDTKIREASTPLIEEFKQNITDFLNIYPIYAHFYLYNDLLTTINDMLLHYTIDETNDDKDFQYIADLLREHGYADINNKYEVNFVEFMNTTLFENVEFIDLPRKEIELRHSLMLWMQDFKECYDFSCYAKSYDDLIDIFSTTKDRLFELIYEKFDKINIQYAVEINKLLTSILNDEELTKVEQNLRENFTSECNDFMKKYKSNRDETNLDLILHIFSDNIISKYYNNTQNIPLKDQQLLKKIFRKHGLKKLLKKYQEEFKDFIHTYLTKLFDAYKSILDENDLEEEKSLLEWHDNIKKLNSHEQRVKEFQNVYDFEED